MTRDEVGEMLDAASGDLQLVTSLIEAEGFRMKWLGVNSVLRRAVLSHPGYVPRYEILKRRWEVRVFNLLPQPKAKAPVEQV